MPTPWPKGTDAARELKARLLDFLRPRFKGAYAARLPRQFVVIEDGNKHDEGASGVRIWIYAGEDEQPPRPVLGGLYEEEWHKVTLDVEADAKAGGAASVEAVFAVLRALFSTAIEREALVAQGLYNVRQSSDHLDVKGVEFSRPFTLTCSTDTAL